MTNSANANDYPWIRAWGQLLGSKDWYIQDQIARARQTNAPANATHEQYAYGADHAYGPTGKWSTTDDITNPLTRRALGLEDSGKD